MAGGIRLGRILGFEIRLDASWFLIFFVIAATLSVSVFPQVYHFDAGLSMVLGTTAAVLLFASVLVHELSHALVARAHGIDVTGITLFLFGGVAQIKGEPADPRQEFQIAGVGPLVSFVLGLLCLAGWWSVEMAQVGGPISALLHYLGVLNVWLALFNLLPGFPLDGGRLLRSAVWKVTGSLQQATRVASLSGQFFAFVMIAYGLVYRVLLAGDLGGLWLVFVGWFLNNAAVAAYQQLVLRGALTGVAVADVMSRDVPAVDGDLRVTEFVDDYLLKYDYESYPVCRDGEFLGMVTVDDVRSLRQNLWGVTALWAIAHAPDDECVVVEENEDAWDALTQMVEANASRLLVLKGGRLAGSISREAIAGLIRSKLRRRAPV